MQNDLSDKELHKLFENYGSNAKEWLRKCAILLPEIARREIWRKLKFSSIYEYAAKLAGMSKSSVDDALWVIRKIEDKPALMRVAQDKGINRVKPIANIATQETAEFWARKACDMSRNTLRVFVRDINDKNKDEISIASGQVKQRHIFDVGNSWAGPKTQPEKVAVSLSLKPELARKLEQLQKRSDFENLLGEFVAFVDSKDEESKPKAVSTKSRHIPLKIKKFVVNKTGGRCAFPGCKKVAKIFHHTQRFALEKVHDPDRIVPLCLEHERLAHLGLIENEDNSPVDWSIRREPDKLDHKWWIDQKVWLKR